MLSGGWIALLWTIAVAGALRGYSGMPGMPSGVPPLPGWSWVLIAAAALTGLAASLLVRRRPVTALYAMVAAAVGIVLTVGPQGLAAQPDQVLGWFLLVADLVLAGIVVTRPPRVWGVALLPVLTALPVAAIHPGMTVDGTAWLAYGVLPPLIAGLIGYAVRQAGENTRRLSAQAAEQAVVAERLRISRELHDHVAHSVGVIALQAGAAARVLDTQPERAREALQAIERTSRDTLSGLRRMVSGLRQAERAPLEPAPGLADVNRLVGVATAAGVAVDLTVSGERRPLSADVELSAYRIIQESLTNVLRHAQAGTCRVTVDYRHGELAIDVVDDGRGGDPTGGGFGLTGLRERVALIDGTITAGARQGGGFEVAARLPVGR